MLAYRYNIESKKYESSINCQKDPIETQIQGKDVWLLPANSTFVEPLPNKEGFNVVWNGSIWEYQEIPQPEPHVPTKEEQEQARKVAYTAEIDPLHARKMRKTILGEWTEEDETEYVEQVRQLSAEIIERYPYPTDPII